MKRSEKARAILELAQFSLDYARREVSRAQIELAGLEAQAIAYEKDPMNDLDEDRRYAPAADRQRTQLEMQRALESEWQEIYDFATETFLAMLDEDTLR